MTDDGTITNRMLLEHQQAMRSDLTKRIDHMEMKMDRKFVDVDRQFAEARQHREALQEDLEATIRM